MQEHEYKARDVCFVTKMFHDNLKVKNLIPSSFDESDCERFEMYHNTQYYFSSINLPDAPICYDVSCICKDKGRGPVLLKLENYLNSLGLRTYFHICRDNTSSENSGIDYKPQISYDEILKIVAQSKVIIDLTQEKQNGLTLRPLEIKKRTSSRVAFSKILCAGINIVSGCMLLASASRSNILAIFVLGLVFLFANIDEWLSIKRRYTGIIQGFIIILIIMLVLLSGSDNMYDSLFKLSNRSLNFTINIPSLMASGKVLFGIGYVDAGLFGSNKLPMATWYVDNSYLYVFLTMGIAGIAWFIFLLARLFFKIRKYDKAFDLNFTFTCVFVTYLFLGMSETCIFYPTFVSSLVYFVAFISCCFIKDDSNERVYE